MKLSTVIGLLLVLSSSAASAQSPVDRAESLLQEGDVAAARVALADAWAEGVPPAQLAPRAYLLRARLATDPDAAVSDYLAVALGHPTSREAPVALVRLGQAMLELGQPARAADYLERVLSDYPASGARGLALLWLARAEQARGRTDAACRTLAAARLATGGDAELASLVLADRDLHCGEATAAASAAPPAPPGGDFATQIGAFRTLDAAERMIEQVRSRGFEARAVLTPTSGLVRVRVGRFLTKAEAVDHARRLRDAGIEALVVNDAAAERRP